MFRNEGSTDRRLRAILGTVLLLALFTPSLPVLALAALISAGTLLLVTATLGFCPLYALFDLDTCSLERSQV